MSLFEALVAQMSKIWRSVLRFFGASNSSDTPVKKQERQPRIAILGAGIGGLGLAIGLIRQGVPVTVYEDAPKFSPIGAGIGFGPNSLDAIDLLDPKFRQMYEDAATENERPEFRNSVFDALYAEEGFGEKRGWTRGLVGAPYFSRSSAHRKDLLQIMESLVPSGVVKFSKHAEEVKQEGDEVVVRFRDGEVIRVDALIGCDGVKGITRGLVLGDRYPEEVAPKYCNMYIYRGIIPMADAKNVLGEHAGDAKWFMAKDRGMAIYPISKGEQENFVFFILNNGEWKEGQGQIPCTKEEMAADLEGFDQRLLKLLDWATPLRWPTFHHPTTSAYYKGRICMLGDVAHASSPHQAAGAGQGLEDAVVLSRLLGKVKDPRDLETAFAVYDEIRRPRAQAVVNTSYEAGDIYHWRDPEIGSDMEKIVENGNQRLHWIWQHDLAGDAKAAEQKFLALVEKQSRTESTSSSVSKGEFV